MKISASLFALTLGLPAMGTAATIMPEDGAIINSLGVTFTEVIGNMSPAPFATSPTFTFEGVTPGTTANTLAAPGPGAPVNVTLGSATPGSFAHLVTDDSGGTFVTSGDDYLAHRRELLSFSFDRVVPGAAFTINRLTVPGSIEVLNGGVSQGTFAVASNTGSGQTLHSFFGYLGDLDEIRFTVPGVGTAPGAQFGIDDFTIVPEPSRAVLLLVGLLAVIARRQR